jgi:hypothetical protein
LVDGLDAEPHGVLRRANDCGHAIDQRLPLLRPVHAREDLYQRRFAGAVIADKSNGFALIDLQADVLQGVDA